MCSGKKGHRAVDCIVKIVSKAAYSVDPKGMKACSWCHRRLSLTGCLDDLLPSSSNFIILNLFRESCHTLGSLVSSPSNAFAVMWRIRF